MEHTPGPWQVYHPHDGGTWVVTHLLDGTRVMIVPRVFSGTTGSKEMQQANAHLIAAAPKLQEELRLLVTYVQQELIPNVREIVGGQEVLDKGWERVGEGHSALALTQVEEAK